MAQVRPDAFEAALASLRRKERSSAELRAWLRKRGYAPDVAESAIFDLTEVGELDDERFARRYAEDKRELRGWGAARIRGALAAREIAADLVERALATDSPESEVGRASELLERRGQPLDREADRARALGFLTRRGYDYDAAYEAVRTVAERRL